MNEKEEAMHTPGPWKATRSDPAEGVDCWWITAGGGNAEKEICSVPGGYRSIEANAALIAAAPELLEALKAAVEIIDKWIEPETMGVVRSGDGVLGHYLRDEYLTRFRETLSAAKQDS